MEEAAAKRIAHSRPRMQPIRFVSGGVQGGTTEGSCRSDSRDLDREPAETRDLDFNDQNYSEDEEAARDLGLM